MTIPFFFTLNGTDFFGVPDNFTLTVLYKAPEINISILYPDDEENITVGNNTPIVTRALGDYEEIENITYEYFNATHNLTVSTVVSSTRNGRAYHVWNTDNVLPGDYKIRIRAYDENNTLLVEEESNVSFTIVPEPPDITPPEQITNLTVVSYWQYSAYFSGYSIVCRFTG